MSEDTEEKEMSQEEIEALEKEREKQKAELKAYWKKELPLLKLQADYEEAITRIEVAKMTRIEIMYAKAQLMAPPREEGPESDGEHRRPDNKDAQPHSKEERKLKTS